MAYYNMNEGLFETQIHNIEHKHCAWNKFRGDEIVETVRQIEHKPRSFKRRRITLRGKEMGGDNISVSVAAWEENKRATKKGPWSRYWFRFRTRMYNGHLALSTPLLS